MDTQSLLYLLKGGHYDMPTRIGKGIWPHPPIKFSECVKVASEQLEKDSFFPDSWEKKINGDLIGDVMAIEKQGNERFICRWRYSDPIDLRKIAEEQEKVFSSSAQAIEYYLRNDLRLPGDLDGWRVVKG